MKMNQSRNYGFSCKEYQNLHGCLAILMGLSNTAITRLTQTWEKIPARSKRLHSELEALVEPSRNHRRYRLYAGNLKPPAIPFMPLLLKGEDNIFKTIFPC